MYINNINILIYVLVIFTGIISGQFLDWYKIRLEEHKKIFSKSEMSVYFHNMKINYKYIILNILLNLVVLYFNGNSDIIVTIMYLLLVPMLLAAFSIDYKLKIIPNRLNLTMFEIGLFFTFLEGIININVAVRMLLGMVAGAGIFMLITLIAGLIAGKEAMGLGDVKFMGALGLYFGIEKIIAISVLSFLLATIIAIPLLIFKKKGNSDYMPFGPFIVLACFITMIVPFDIIVFVLFKIFTLGSYRGSLILKK